MARHGRYEEQPELPLDDDEGRPLTAADLEDDGRWRPGRNRDPNNADERPYGGGIGGRDPYHAR